MNFKISNILPFKAKYTTYGKQSPKETDKLYSTTIDEMRLNKILATNGQRYIQSQAIQDKIAYQIPNDTFISLHTGVLTDENKNDKILGFTPFLLFQAKGVNEQNKFKKECGQDADILKLSLDEDGNLDTQAVDCWLDTIIDYYS